MNYTSTNEEIIVSFDAIRSIARSGPPGIYIVKPRAILSELETRLGIPHELNLNFPSSQIGSITLLEGAIMVGLAKLVDSRNIFEFGTFLGYSTRLFLKNFNSAGIYSLDLELSEDQVAEYSSVSKDDAMDNDVDNDNFLKSMQQKEGTIYLANLSDSEESRLTLIKGNSLEFRPSEFGLKGEVDFTFIDGGHQKEEIDSDTINAREMQSANSVVAWHDFNSNIHGDVTSYLIEASRSEVIFHVQSTMIAFSISKEVYE